MKCCDTIKRYAKQRQRAYEITKTMTGRRAKAISNIIKIAEYLKGTAAEWRAVINTKDDLIAILPSEDSRFKKQRNQILTLIKQCHG